MRPHNVPSSQLVLQLHINQQSGKVRPRKVEIRAQIHWQCLHPTVKLKFWKYKLMLQNEDTGDRIICSSKHITASLTKRETMRSWRSSLDDTSAGGAMLYRFRISRAFSFTTLPDFFQGPILDQGNFPLTSPYL